MPKYNFVYDTDVLKTFSVLQLSEEEKRVVLATVIGNHNAIFYGYKPERLVYAVKALSHCNIFEVNEGNQLGVQSIVSKAENGIVFINDMYKIVLTVQQFIDMVSENTTRKAQFIGTTSSTPKRSMITSLIDHRFDIIYECAENAGIICRSELTEQLAKARKLRSGWDSGKHITGKLDYIENFWVSNEFFDMYTNEPNRPLALKFAKVGRSLSDIDRVCVPLGSWYKEAESLYNIDGRTSV